MVQWTYLFTHSESIVLASAYCSDLITCETPNEQYHFQSQYNRVLAGGFSCLAQCSTLVSGSQTRQSWLRIPINPKFPQKNKRINQKWGTQSTLCLWLTQISRNIGRYCLVWCYISQCEYISQAHRQSQSGTLHCPLFYRYIASRFSTFSDLIKLRHDF